MDVDPSEPRPAPRAPAPAAPVRAHDFRLPAFLSPGESRRLRQQQEEFARSLAARLSLYLRLEVALNVGRIETRTYDKFVQALPSPTHLTLFKIEPLRGICVLQLSPRLGLVIVDRLMGGPGKAESADRDLSEIEIALLDETAQILVGEWCGQWSAIQELHAVLLGHENNPRFLQTAPADTVMLVLDFEARIGDCVEPLQLGFPFPTIEPLVGHLRGQIESASRETPAPAPAAPQWKPEFDTVPLQLTAEWPDLQVSARDVTRLKVGDVLEWNPDLAGQVRLRLARAPKFIGNLGTRNGKWAVEITRVLAT